MRQTIHQDDRRTWNLLVGETAMHGLCGALSNPGLSSKALIDHSAEFNTIDEPAYTQNYHSDCRHHRWNVAAYPGPASALNLAGRLAPKRFLPSPRSI
jgi:hypothetical protein